MILNKFIVKNLEKMYDLRFNINSKFLLSGPSGSGKTVFIKNIIKNLNSLFKTTFSEIIFVYNIYQDIYDNIQEISPVSIRFFSNFNIEEYILNLKGENVIIILDDQMLSKDIDIYSKLFTVYGRHKNLTVFFLTQKLFLNDKNYRIISENTDYLILFNNPRNHSSISILGSQILPGNAKAFRELFSEATKKPYSHLLCDFTQEQKNYLRFRSNYFEEEGIIKVFILNRDLQTSILDQR